MLSLLQHAPKRSGRNGPHECREHPWFEGLSWADLRSIPAPHLPEGGLAVKSLMTKIREVDPAKPEEKMALVEELTCNFDRFEENGTMWGASKTLRRRDKDTEFIGYTFKRKKDLVGTALSAEIFGWAAEPSAAAAEKKGDADL